MFPTGLGLDSISIAQILFVVVVAFWLSMMLSVGTWVFRDARARGSDIPGLWGAATAFQPLFLLYYFYRRYRRAGIGERATPASRADRFLGTWACASLLAFAVGASWGPPDPFTQIRYILGIFAVLLPFAYLLIYRGGLRRARGAVGP